MNAHKMLITSLLVLLIVLMATSIKQFFILSLSLLSLKYVWIILILVIALAVMKKRAG